jgi:hypothetical protein
MYNQNSLKICSQKLSEYVCKCAHTRIHKHTHWYVLHSSLVQVLYLEHMEIVFYSAEKKEFAQLVSETLVTAHMLVSEAQKAVTGRFNGCQNTSIIPGFRVATIRVC